MRYPTEHKAATRKRLLSTVGAVAKKNGFAATGVDTLAQAAGLTSGVFYSHFGSKAELLTALVEHDLGASVGLFADATSDLPRDQWIVRQIKRYLSWKHVRQPETGCLAPSLAAEVARAGTDTKAKFEEAILDIHAVWRDKLQDDAAAWAVVSQLVGAVLLSRAMAHDAIAKKILDANRAVLQAALVKD